jgi:hypothetical protein
MKLTKHKHKTVTQGEWGVGFTTGDGIEGVHLSVYRFRVNGKELRGGLMLRGDGYGRMFPDMESARQWAFDHGYTQLYFSHPDLRARRKASATRS